jgi:hypothetical protein
MRYSIEGQELTDIADALRGKTGETKLIDSTEPISTQIAPTFIENVSLDRLSGSMDVGAGIYELITFPNTERIHIKVKYNLNGYEDRPCNQYLKMSVGDYYIEPTNFYGVSDKMPENSIHITGIGEQEFWFDGDTVTIYYGADNWNLPAGNYGYCAECTMYGKAEVPNTYTTAQMAQAIEELPIIPEEALTITGDCKYRFANGGWDWFVKNCGDKIVTKNISNANSMFLGNSLMKEIPFVINMKQDMMVFANFLNNAEFLTVAPTIKVNLVSPNYVNIDLQSILSNCKSLRYAENMFNPDELEPLSTIKVTSAYSCPKYNNIFNYCTSLRQVPSWFYKLRVSNESTASPSQYNWLYYNLFNNCYALDEANDIQVTIAQGAANSNMFIDTMTNCYRLKNFTFETNEDGTPKVVKWKSQTLDFTKNIGWVPGTYYINGFNSGITEDKEVKDDAGYQALKDDPDWWTQKVDYCRYNHDSAVATINSLPDTSAYASGNIIKFKGAHGSKTDGGAINTLTEEEIAVATAKGWTISFA